MPKKSSPKPSPANPAPAAGVNRPALSRMMKIHEALNRGSRRVINCSSLAEELGYDEKTVPIEQHEAVFVVLSLKSNVAPSCCDDPNSHAASSEDFTLGCACQGCRLAPGAASSAPEEPHAPAIRT